MYFNLIMLNDIKDHLKAKQKTLSVAESVTSGHLQAAFSAAREASLFFQGGITTYNLGQKTRHLNVEPIYADSCNCVSQEVAHQMARECSRLFLSNYSIAVTGYATPLPDKGITELFAYFSIYCDDSLLEFGKIVSKKTDSVEAQLDFTNQIVERFFLKLREQAS